ncbi:MAG: molecular chaperone DnaJ [Gloeocapsa sp. DLM2.Bin57]|nr:MAG: molecular chaperone DnaJ [Gloeocapsa sp. DLM2.Bin57]
MSEQSPYEQLGVGENASFEEIQDAKKRLTLEYQNEPKIVQTIEAAYDSIIMDRLRMRQEGKIKVPDQIRFPEKSLENLTSIDSEPIPTPPNWLKRLLDNPSVSEIIWPGVIFLLLSVITVLVKTDVNSPISLLLAFGFGANIYFLNRKERLFGRAFLISLLGLCLGLGIGYGLANLLITPNTGIIFNQEQFACLFTFCLFWLISSFIR